MENASRSTALARRMGAASASDATPAQTTRVLKNTYALLSLTLLFSAGVAAATVANGWPAPGLVITLVGYFGLALTGLALGIGSVASGSSGRAMAVTGIVLSSFALIAGVGMLDG